MQKLCLQTKRVEFEVHNQELDYISVRCFQIPSNSIPSAQYIETKQPQIPKTYLTVRNNRRNQILGDSGILCKCQRNNKIDSSVAHRYCNSGHSLTTYNSNTEYLLTVTRL